MGIKDLLRFMKPYTEGINIEKFAGKRVGIDAYSWLHKGAYSCSMELSLNTDGEGEGEGDKKKKLHYINYFMHRINLLRHHHITPVVVFDGGNIPCKAATDNLRSTRRLANKDLAIQQLSLGNLNAAIQLFQRAITITPSMAHLLTQTLISENVEFLVAPYEADAQLAYLSTLPQHHGGISTVITEDSDLLPYACPSIVFKMDRFGNGEEIILDKVFKSTNSKPSFRNFNTTLFIDMCVLAGCDFLPSIPGIGIGKAHALVSKYRNTERVLSVLKLKGKQVPDDYARSFKEAVAVFQHATIYNKNKKRVEHMKEVPEELLESLGELDFLGPNISSTIATAIAEGKLDPTTMEAYDCHTQSSQQSESSLGTSQKSIARNIPGEAEEMIQIFNRKNYKVPQLPLEVNLDKVKQAQSCFTVYSSVSMRDKKISNTNAATVERQVLKERNFIDETTALANLAAFLEVDNNAEELRVSEEFPVKTPDNNPFRKRKFDSENAPGSGTTPSIKSSVTQVDTSQNVYSQHSVNSKLQKLEHTTEVVGKEKISSCKNSATRSSSILNFFNRI